MHLMQTASCALRVLPAGRVRDWSPTCLLPTMAQQQLPEATHLACAGCGACGDIHACGFAALRAALASARVTAAPAITVAPLPCCSPGPPYGHSQCLCYPTTRRQEQVDRLASSPIS